MIKIRYTFSTTILFMLVLNLTSCQATVRGSGGKEFYKLKRSLAMPQYWEVMVHKGVKPVYDAALMGIEELGLSGHESKVDELSGIIEGNFSGNTKFNIMISYESPSVTLMRIRVGVTGNKHLVVRLFKEIEKHF